MNLAMLVGTSQLCTMKAPEKGVPVGVALWSFTDMEEKVRSCETLRLQPCLVKHPPGERALLLVLRRPRDGSLPSTTSILSKINLFLFR